MGRCRPAWATTTRCGWCGPASGCRPTGRGSSRWRTARRWPGRPAAARRALGYHDLALERTGRQVRLIVSPGRCHLPAGLHAWGFALQLYAVRSADSWGMGDLADLRTLGEWATSLGAGMLLVNPLHAVLPGLPQQASPYYPSSRCFRNPLYLRVDARAARRRPVAQHHAPHPPRRRLRAEAGSARGQVGALRGRRRLRPLLPRGGADARGLRHLLGPGRAARAAVAAVALGCAPPRRRRTSPSSPPSSPSASVSTSGCSGCSTASWPPPAPRSGWCTTSPSASTRPAPTPGCGRTRSRSACASAPRPTSSTPTARTGACRRSTRGGCAWPASSRSSRRCAPACAARPACAWTT